MEPGQPKDPDESAVFEFGPAFASDADTESMQVAFKEGIGWGDAKNKLFNLVNHELVESRERYFDLIQKPVVEDLLIEGSKSTTNCSKEY